VGKMARFWQFCNFQEVAKMHCSQQPLRGDPLHLAQIFHNVCSFRPLFQICDILCYSEVIWLASAEVGKKSPSNLQIFAPQNFKMDRDRAPSVLHYKITPHSDILAKVMPGGILQPQRLEHEKNK